MQPDGYLQPHSGPFAVISSPFDYKGHPFAGFAQSRALGRKAMWTHHPQLKMAFDPTEHAVVRYFQTHSSTLWAQKAGDEWVWVATWLAAFWRSQLTLGRIMIFMKWPEKVEASTGFVLERDQSLHFTVVNYCLQRTWIGANTDGIEPNDIYRIMSLITGESDPYVVIDPSGNQLVSQEMGLWAPDFWTNPLRNEESWMRLYLGQDPKMRGESTAPACYTLWGNTMQHSNAIIQKYG